ncbi:PH domain-containing protein [Brevibacterium casei]|nr:PH domain-containing protein [Brevibacterium casei]
MGYRVDDEAIYARSGLIAKKVRKARLDRVQSIDLQQKLLPRLLGLAELVFDVAGGKGSNVSLKYLSRKRADLPRDELLAAVRDVKQAAAPADAPGPGRARARRRRGTASAREFPVTGETEPAHRRSTSQPPNAPETASACG